MIRKFSARLRFGLAAGFLAAGLLACQAADSPRHPFFAYNFGRLTESPPAAQIQLLRDLGYDGISLGCESDADLKGLDDYFRAVEAQGPAFRIFAVYIFYNFKAPAADRERWKALLEKIAGRGIELWLIIGPGTEKTTDKDVSELIATVADAARLKNVSVTVYPHNNCYIATAEDALRFVAPLQRQNLGLAFHLCHEIRAGHGGRLPEVAQKVAPYLRFATLAGTNSQVDWTTSLTMENSTIMPLDKGDYDLRQFLQALQTANYQGPVGFINFLIKEEPSDYLARSIKKWRSLEAEVAGPSSPKSPVSGSANRP